jgi:nitrate reductase alpha subunit
MLGGAADGRPAIDTDAKMAEAILTFSGTTNGELAVQGFETLEKRVGKPLSDLAHGSDEKRITFAQTQQALVSVITSPEWSGSETGGRRYAPVHHQRGATGTLAHADRPDALLPRPRLDIPRS